MTPGDRRDDSAIGRRALVVAAVLAIAIGGLYWYLQRGAGPAAPKPPSPQPTAAPAAAPAPAVQNPLPEAPQAAEEPPLPKLDASDPLAIGQLAGLFGQDTVSKLFAADGLIRRITATVDNLPREKVAMQVRPLKTMDSQFIANGEDGSYTMGPDNYARYEPYIHLVEALDPDAAVKVYVHLYPLFQQAYVELGNPSGYFNDRVVEVIDNLLAAPDLQGPVALVRPNVMYKFADPGLESLSAGQKLMLRIGPANAARVKAKLKAIRDLISASPPGGG